jgi:flagellum-specific peptidoglycan hydrolase FlgJ
MSKLSPAQTVQLQAAVSSSVACQRRTKVPAELTISQWALESGWGEHQPGNNCFGIKSYPGCFGVQQLKTVEVIAGVRTVVAGNFATFPSLEACFEKHATLLTTGRAYGASWSHYLKSADPQMLIREIGPIYATDPQYANKLLQVISMPEVGACLAEYRKGS